MLEEAKKLWSRGEFLRAAHNCDAAASHVTIDHLEQYKIAIDMAITAYKAAGDIFTSMAFQRELSLLSQPMLPSNCDALPVDTAGLKSETLRDFAAEGDAPLEKGGKMFNKAKKQKKNSGSDVQGKNTQKQKTKKTKKTKKKKGKNKMKSTDPGDAVVADSRKNRQNRDNPEKESKDKGFLAGTAPRRTSSTSGSINDPVLNLDFDGPLCVSQGPVLNVHSEEKDGLFPDNSVRFPETARHRLIHDIEQIEYLIQRLQETNQSCFDQRLPGGGVTRAGESFVHGGIA